MSEYQCYEFVALDRPLTSKQIAELRAISTRAEITPARFWNEYQWGDLKADPVKLVEQYFDAHMYFANWGTHRLVLRVPVARVNAKSLKGYFVGDAARAKVAGEHLVLDLHSQDEEPEYDEKNQGSLAALAPLRAELMRATFVWRTSRGCSPCKPPTSPKQRRSHQCRPASRTSPPRRRRWSSSSASTRT